MYTHNEVVNSWKSSIYAVYKNFLVMRSENPGYKAIPEIKEFLDIANINEFTVFPDLQGLSYFIKNLLL